MTKTTADRLIEAMLGGLSVEGIDEQCKHEFRQAHPTYSEAEIELMFRADRKQGYPPRSLAQARRILGMIDKSKFNFCNWDNRPAVLVGYSAFAVLSPRAPWVTVDRSDVYNTSAEMSEAAWRTRFAGEGYGALDLSRIRDPSISSAHPAPTPKDFDDAALAVMKEARRPNVTLEIIHATLSANPAPPKPR
jgi:hypothetical protein